MNPDEIKQMLTNLDDERNGAALYRTLAKTEVNPQLKEIYLRMAAVEDRHANTWINQLQEAKVTVPPFSVSWRTRILGWAARRFGTGSVLPSIVGMEQKANTGYAAQPGVAKSMVGEEGSHARILSRITRTLPGGLEGGTLAMMEGRHRASGGNALRAAVLGANDGLLSNLSLVMGVAGASMTNRQVLITGLAGMLAGAFSMALGEWLSVQSSRELYAHQIKIETQELEIHPEEEAEEMALIYESRGVEPEQARQLAARIMEDHTSAIETLSREELNIDPEELGGSAWEAALASFFLFAVGAIIPVIPYIFFSGNTAIIISILCGLLGLFIIGAGITLFTGRPAFISGIRQVFFGLVAAAITYAIGRLIGVSLGG